MDEKKLEEIIQDGVSGPINNISRILDNHFNPPKRTNYSTIIIYVLIGTAIIWCMYAVYSMLQPFLNYNIPI